MTKERKVFNTKYNRAPNPGTNFTLNRGLVDPSQTRSKEDRVMDIMAAGLRMATLRGEQFHAQTEKDAEKVVALDNYAINKLDLVDADRLMENMRAKYAKKATTPIEEQASPEIVPDNGKAEASDPVKESKTE